MRRDPHSWRHEGPGWLVAEGGDNADEQRIGWIDASVGASGDMLLGALVDAGVPLETLQAPIDQLDLDISLSSETVLRSGLGATKVHVEAPEQQSARHLPEILGLLSSLPAPVAERASAVFIRLAEAEAAVHRTSIDEVHFHEVGAADAIADVVGVVAGLVYLGVDTLSCSTLGVGQGSAASEHGRMPVPVPAVVELIAGVPAAAGPAPFEALTPTGAALLVTLVDDWGPLPAMLLSASGSGAGTRDQDDYANIVRLLVGAASATAAGTMTQLDANVDDLDPRMWPVVLEAVLAAGAVDAWLTPITMKKGRPAFTVSALFQSERRNAVHEAIFAHTTTIGVRHHVVSRETLERQISTIDVDGQPIRVKTALRNGAVVNRSIEWDDVVAAADALDRTTKQVLAQATAIAALD